MGCCVGVPEEVKNYDNFHEGELASAPTATNAVDEKYQHFKGEYATFGCGGDFHAAESRFSLVPGVIRTRVGFSGGTAVINLADGKIFDHTEVVDIEFDPSVVKFETLLGHFWLTHDPMPSQGDILHKAPPEERLKQSRKRRKGEGKMKHHSIIFYHNEEQRKRAEQELVTEDRERRTVNNLAKGHVQTDVIPIQHVYPAAREHQHFFLQQDKFLSDLTKCQTSEDWQYSFLACKLNGFCTPLANIMDLKAVEADFSLLEGIQPYLMQKFKYID